MKCLVKIIVIITFLSRLILTLPVSNLVGTKIVMFSITSELGFRVYFHTENVYTLLYSDTIFLCIILVPVILLHYINLCKVPILILLTSTQLKCLTPILSVVSITVPTIVPSDFTILLYQTPSPTSLPCPNVLVYNHRDLTGQPV